MSAASPAVRAVPILRRCIDHLIDLAVAPAALRVVHPHLIQLRVDRP